MAQHATHTVSGKTRKEVASWESGSGIHMQHHNGTFYSLYVQLYKFLEAWKPVLSH